MSLALLTGCATIQVDPVDVSRYPIDRVCIERNPRADVPAMLGAVRDAFRRNHVATVVREAGDIADCDYVLRYTALRDNDIKTFMKSAHLEISRDGESIGSIDYQQHGGLDFTRYARTADKLDPLIDRLLQGQKRR